VVGVEGVTLRAIETPGHCADHFGFFLIPTENPEQTVVFSGDCILGQGTTVLEDLAMYMDSLDKIAALSAQEIYPGHGPKITRVAETIVYYISHRNKREASVLALLQERKQYLTAMEIVKVVYAAVAEHLHVAAARNVVLHLGKLTNELKVVAEEVTEGEKRWKALAVGINANI
jgi:glyoxylase-like metal-dependent hydrolase (beta-lactamase superfamily II)